MPNEPIMSLEEAKQAVATKTLPKVTEQSIKDKIEDISYVYHDHLTICIITMLNGFMVHGVSAPASIGNYDPNVGQRYAFENAFRQLWQLEGYMLREKLAFGDWFASMTQGDPGHLPNNSAA